MLGALTLCGAAFALNNGDPAPALDAKVVSKNTASLKFEDHKDKVVVVEFWATWCPPCRASIPHVNALYKKHKDKVVVIGISGENEKVVADFLKKQKEMEYVVACNGGKTAAAYGVNGIPHAFVIVDGKVVWNGHPMNGLDKAVEDAIKTLKPADAKKDAPAKK
jgi:thiol-disulfide isomerase/thioredoxin